MRARHICYLATAVGGLLAPTADASAASNLALGSPFVDSVASTWTGHSTIAVNRPSWTAAS